MGHENNAKLLATNSDLSGIQRKGYKIVYYLLARLSHESSKLFGKVETMSCPEREKKNSMSCGVYSPDTVGTVTLENLVGQRCQRDPPTTPYELKYFQGCGCDS